MKQPWTPWTADKRQTCDYITYVNVYISIHMPYAVYKYLQKTYDVCFRQYVIFDTPHADTDDTPGATAGSLTFRPVPTEQPEPTSPAEEASVRVPGLGIPAGIGTWFLFSNFTNFQVPAVVLRGSIATLPKWTVFWEIGECTCCRTSEISP